MNYIKKIGKTLLYIFVPILISMFLFTILNYIGLISYKIINVLKYIILLTFILIGAFILGKTTNKKGWLEGLKLGLILIVILIIFNYIVFSMPFSIKAIVYYGMILSTSVLGSILGIGTKRKK